MTLFAACAAAMIWVALAQTKSRLVRPKPPSAALVLRWTLLVYGVLLIVLIARSQARHHPVGPASMALLVGVAALAIGFGVLRGSATTLCDRDNGIYRRGGAIVVALWALSLGAHVALGWTIDRESGIGGLGTATILVYAVLTIAAQNITIRRRASRV